MPIFNDKAEAIDNCVLCYEKLAKALKIPDAHWAINVSSFLQGSAKAVCHSMPEEKADNYEELKKGIVTTLRAHSRSFQEDV